VNHRTSVQRGVNGLRLVALAGLLAAASLSPLEAQSATSPVQVKPPEGFQQQQKLLQLTPLDIIREFEAPEEKAYHFGEGDEIAVEVWGRGELSGKHTIGPDGYITLPLLGDFRLSGLSREEAPKMIEKLYSRYYDSVSVTIRIERYNSNRVFVLGRVANPGTLVFDFQPTLLDVLTRAGSLPIGGVGAEKAGLARCAVFRGRDRIIWIDLKQLFSEGNLSYNIRLARNDLVYLPDADDQLVYVIGEAQHPGAFRLTPSMSFIDALALAGGTTADAAENKIVLVRPRTQQQMEFPLKDIVERRLNPSVKLEEGDIVYVPRRGWAKFGYMLNKVSSVAGFAILYSVARP
jgi:polysaccharide biosynthesis/export protein